MPASQWNLPFLKRQKLPPHRLRMAAGLTQPEQWAQYSVDGATIKAAELQAPVRDFPEFDQSVLRADLMLTVVEVALHWGEVQPVYLLCLWWNLNLGEKKHLNNINLFQNAHFKTLSLTFQG